MPATTTPVTFLDLKNALLNAVRAQSGTTAADAVTVAYAGRYINDANQDVHTAHAWPWAERRAMLQTHATYATGTIAIALAARTTVTGTSTLWNTAVTGMGFTNVRVGGKLLIETNVYEVASVASDTVLTLTDRFVGATALTAASYLYFEDEYALASDFWRPVDLRMFSVEMKIGIIGRQEFYRAYPKNASPAQPGVSTFLELGPGATTAPRPRVVFHPPPDQVYNIPYRYLTTNLAVSTAGVGAANLSADDDEPILPLRYRRILVLHAMREWYRDRKDDQRSQETNAEYTDLWRRMAGDSAPTDDRPRLRHARGLYIAGTAGYRRRSPRYDTGGAFDDMRI